MLTCARLLMDLAEGVVQIANIRLAAGRNLLPQNGAVAFKFGASAKITGNMLTTSGSNIQKKCSKSGVLI